VGSVGLAQIVERLTIDDRREVNTPLLFWPLPPNIFVENELIGGRSSFYWKDRISSFWGSYFGTYEKFLGASCELEFVLELNSYLGTNTVNDSKIQASLEANGKRRSFIYNPDFYSYDLRCTVPMAERCYDAIARQSSLCDLPQIPFGQAVPTRYAAPAAFSSSKVSPSRSSR
jgi:hypothetical protein